MSIEYQAKAAAPADMQNANMQLFADAINTDTPVFIPFPGSGRLDSVPAVLGAIGYAEAGDGQDFTYDVKLYVGVFNPGDALDASKLVEIGAGTSGTCEGGKRSVWIIRSSITYVSQAGAMIGEVGSTTDATMTAPVVFTAPIDELDNGLEPITSFYLGVLLAPPPPPTQQAEEPESEAEPKYIPPPPLPGTAVKLPTPAKAGFYLTRFYLGAA